MKLNTNFVVAISIALSSVRSFAAQDDFYKTVRTVGSQTTTTGSGSVGYFTINESFTLPCSNSVMYIDLSSPAGRVMWASVLLSKKTNGTIFRINYTADSYNNCTADLVEIQ